MEIIAFGLILSGAGLWLVCDRNFWWEWQQIENDLNGVQSLPNLAWNAKLVISGMVMMGVGLYCSWLGIRVVWLESTTPITMNLTGCPTLEDGANAPTPPTSESTSDRYFRIGCEAAHNGDYHTALINFQRALESAPHDDMSSHIYLPQMIEQTEELIAEQRRRPGTRAIP